MLTKVFKRQTKSVILNFNIFPDKFKLDRLLASTSHFLNLRITVDDNFKFFTMSRGSTSHFTTPKTLVPHFVGESSTIHTTVVDTHVECLFLWRDA